VIKADSLRTTVRGLDTDLRNKLEKLLTYYCKFTNKQYIQGLNEVAVPFLMFIKIDISISDIYNYMMLFIEKFLKTIFYDKVSSRFLHNLKLGFSYAGGKLYVAEHFVEIS
jgi:hypothetical protein